MGQQKSGIEGVAGATDQCAAGSSQEAGVLFKGNISAHPINQGIGIAAQIEGQLIEIDLAGVELTLKFRQQFFDRGQIGNELV